MSKHTISETGVKVLDHSPDRGEFSVMMSGLTTEVVSVGYVTDINDPDNTFVALADLTDQSTNFQKIVGMGRNIPLAISVAGTVTGSAILTYGAIIA